MVAGTPKTGIKVPSAVAVLAHGRRLKPVWENELGGLTFMIGDGHERRFVKWVPADAPIDLAAEARRMEWARSYTPVPDVLGQGADSDGSWLLTDALPGESAVAGHWLADPASAVTAIGRGLRAFHDALPVEACPFSWSAADRLADARHRAARGDIDPRRWHEDHQGLGIDEAMALLANPPPVDELVVCHGDTCAPNTLITDDGNWSGHVDLGEMGVSDRWADLAIATWSTQWNYGAGWEQPLLDAYGIEADPTRTRYYRLLWDLGP